jgi:hypothetical protein
VTAFRNAKEFLATTQADDWTPRSDRREASLRMHRRNAAFHQWLLDHLEAGHDQDLGLALGPDAPKSIRRDGQGRPVFEVHSFRPCRRIGPDGQVCTDALVEIIQRRLAFFDRDLQGKVDQGEIAFADAKKQLDFHFRGGCTLLLNPETGDIRYAICKSIRNENRLEQERRSRQGQFGDKVGGIYLTGGRDDLGNPFAFLHGW